MWWDNFCGQLPFSTVFGKMTKKKQAKLQNDIEFLNYFELLTSLALDQFEWENLPDTVDVRMLERAFLSTGRALLAQVDGSYLSLMTTPGGNINIYGYPITAWGYGYNGYNREFRAYVPGSGQSNQLVTAAGGNVILDTPEAVVGYDNIDGYPYIRYIQVAAARLADLVRTCDVCASGLKSPYLISCEDNQVQTVRDALAARQDNVATIVGSSKSISSDMFRVWPTATDPGNLSAVWTQYCNIFNQILEILGINTNQMSDKKERLLVAEVESNNDLITRNAKKRLAMRQKFADECNECFGLNITVKLKYGEEDNYGRPDDTEGVDDDTRPGDTMDGERD